MSYAASAQNLPQDYVHINKYKQGYKLKKGNQKKTNRKKTLIKTKLKKNIYNLFKKIGLFSLLCALRCVAVGAVVVAAVAVLLSLFVRRMHRVQ